MIPYGHQSINKKDVAAVAKVLESDWLTQGPDITAFEEALAKYCGVKYAVCFSSGTAALHGAYFAAGLGVGDEFITTPLTFVATANAGLYLGARPVFADVDDNGNLDIEEAKKKITAKTKMIVPVDFAGNPVAIDQFMKLAKERGLVVVLDACHSLGAEFKNRKIGASAHMSVFSFHPVKSITTGEGGAVLTNDKSYYEKLKTFRTHGITKLDDWNYEMRELGFNYRMTDIQAALGASQLKRLDKFIAKRRKIVEIYKAGFSAEGGSSSGGHGLGEYLELPKESSGGKSSWHLYPIRLKGALIAKKLGIFRALRQAGIGVQVHYIPVYLQPYYQKLGYKKGSCPKAEQYYEAEISLPIYPDLKKEDQEFVIKKFKEIINLCYLN